MALLHLLVNEPGYGDLFRNAQQFCQEARMELRDVDGVTISCEVPSIDCLIDLERIVESHAATGEGPGLPKIFLETLLIDLWSESDLYESNEAAFTHLLEVLPLAEGTLGVRHPFVLYCRIRLLEVCLTYGGISDGWSQVPTLLNQLDLMEEFVLQVRVLAYSLEIGLRHLLDLLDSFEMNQRETQLVLEQINQVTKGLVSKSVDKRYPEALYDSVNSEELEDILSQCEELLGPKRAMVLASARQVLFPFD